MTPPKNAKSIVDMVGMGNNACVEGEAAENVSAGTSLERKARRDSTAESLAPGGAHALDGNRFDWNDNAGDFVLHEPLGHDPQIDQLGSLYDGDYQSGGERHVGSPHLIDHQSLVDGDRLVVTATEPDAPEPRLDDRANLTDTRVVVLDREGNELLDVPGFMPDWMPPWH